MDILSLDADRRLFSIASSIGRAPKSWSGWHCLWIKIETDETDMAQDCLVWSRAVVQSYLNAVEGRIYACGNGDIHIICRDAGKNLLDQVGTHICDYINAGNMVAVSYVIYDLESDGFSYASNVLSQNGDILSRNESIYDNMDLSERKGFLDVKVCVEKTQNQHGFTKVLLVEDDPVTRWMVRHALKDECHLATAPTANRAFALYPSWKPDVVFLDIHLPDNNGLAVLEWIKRNDPGVCVVMFSSANNMDSIAGALEDGANGFVAKPFLKETLVHYVRASNTV